MPTGRTKRPGTPCEASSGTRMLNHRRMHSGEGKARTEWGLRRSRRKLGINFAHSPVW